MTTAACPGNGGAARAALVVARDIKLAHSVFALPFALLAGFMHAPRDAAGAIRWDAMVGMLTLVVACMVAARTWAMVVNRLADRRLDAANPRTRGRAFAAGVVSPRVGVAALVASAAAFLLACAGFGVFFGNWWPVGLAVPVLGWIGLYSFTKRFTWLCHLFLGSALAASPLAAALAVGGPAALADAALWALAGMVALWVGGFDVVYALQDLEHDRSAGLHSVPARFGWAGGVLLSRLAHAGALACLAAVWALRADFGWLFAVGVGATGALLLAEHLVLWRRGRAGIPMAFFTLNGCVSLLLGGLGVMDVVV